MGGSDGYPDGMVVDGMAVEVEIDLGEGDNYSHDEGGEVAADEEDFDIDGEVMEESDGKNHSALPQVPPLEESLVQWEKPQCQDKHEGCDINCVDVAAGIQTVCAFNPMAAGFSANCGR